MQDHVDMTDIHQLILGVKESLDAHKQTVETQIIKLSESFHAHLDEKIELMGGDIKNHIKESIEDIQRYVDTGVGRITTQIEDVVTRVSALEETQTTEFDPEVSVIMPRVPQNEDEDIHQTAEKIIHEGLRLPEIRVYSGLLNYTNRFCSFITKKLNMTLPCHTILNNKSQKCCLCDLLNLLSLEFNFWD